MTVKKNIEHENSRQGEYPPRILYFTEASQGIGLFSIADKISKELHKRGAEVVMVSGSFGDARKAFTFSGAPCESLPHVVNRDGKYRCAETGIAFEGDATNARKKRVQEICEKYKPDLVLFDLYPFVMSYRQHDADAIKEWASNQDRRPAMVCLCRDIIHNPNPDKVLQQLETYIDEVLVGGCGKIIKLSDSMKEWKRIKTPTRYIGNIVSEMPEATDPLNPERAVVVSAGGGYLPEKEEPFYVNSIKARKFSKQLADKPWLIFVPDNCPAETVAKFEKLAHEESPDGKIQILRLINDTQFRCVLADSALTIMRGGYNTSFELASAGKPFVMIPRMGKGFEEQPLRAHTMSAHGFCSSIPQQELSPEHLANVVDHEYGRIARY